MKIRKQTIGRHSITRNKCNKNKCKGKTAAFLQLGFEAIKTTIVSTSKYFYADEIDGSNQNNPRETTCIISCK